MFDACSSSQSPEVMPIPCSLPNLAASRHAQARARVQPLSTAPTGPRRPDEPLVAVTTASWLAAYSSPATSPSGARLRFTMQKWPPLCRQPKTLRGLLLPIWLKVCILSSITLRQCGTYSRTIRLCCPRSLWHVWTPPGKPGPTVTVPRTSLRVKLRSGGPPDTPGLKGMKKRTAWQSLGPRSVPHPLYPLQLAIYAESDEPSSPRTPTNGGKTAPR